MRGLRFRPSDYCGICGAKFRVMDVGTAEGRCRIHNKDKASTPQLWGIRHPDGSIQQRYKKMVGHENKISLISGSCAWPSKKEAKRHMQNRSDKIVRVRIVEEDISGYIFNPVTGSKYPVLRRSQKGRNSS